MSYSMPVKKVPLLIFLRALLLFNGLTLVMWIVVSLLNRYNPDITVFFVLSSLVTSIVIFLPYLLWYVDKLSKRGFIAFVPFLISLLLLANLLYGLWTGKMREMSFSMRHTVRLWQSRSIEFLLVFLTCLHVYARYFRLPGRDR